MNNRYLISLSVPKSISDSLSQIHHDLLHQPIQIGFLHLSLLHPFFLNHVSEQVLVERVKNTPFTPVTIKLEKLDFFTQNGNQILYIHANAQEKLSDLHEALNRQLGESITIDPTPFGYSEIPDFLPHISLNYNFPDDPRLVSQAKNFSVSIQFTADKIDIAKETSPHNWQQIY